MDAEVFMVDNQVELKHKDVTEKILHAFYKIVYPQLGYGFLEKVYGNAMVIALASLGMKAVPQVEINVYFQNQVVGQYFADLVVNNLVIVELKAVTHLVSVHEAQLLNYLRATPYEVGLILNFGPKPDFKRKAYGNHRKNITWEPK